MTMGGNARNGKFKIFVVKSIIEIYNPNPKKPTDF
jgi:hypothetical protein